MGVDFINLSSSTKVNSPLFTIFLKPYHNWWCLLLGKKIFLNFFRHNFIRDSMMRNYYHLPSFICSMKAQAVFTATIGVCYFFRALACDWRNHKQDNFRVDEKNKWIKKYRFMGCQTVSLMQRKKNYIMTAKDSRMQHPSRLNLSGTDASSKCRKKYI